MSTPHTQNFSISERAAKQINSLVKKEDKKALMLRVIVNGGGCAGFQYSFDFDETQNDEDIIFSKDGARVIMDDVSLEILNGSELDYVDDLIGSFFQITNPNAKSTCGCGSSFAI